MFTLVLFVLFGACLPRTLSLPASVVTGTVTVPTKYPACKANDCPPFRVVRKIASDIELREYSWAWWASTRTQAPRINSNVTSSVYWRLRRYLSGRNDQTRYLKMGVPVTRLVETTANGEKSLTMSFYLSFPECKPPRPSDTKVSIEYKSLHVYVKIFKGVAFSTRVGEGHAGDLAKALVSRGLDGTFYSPGEKYMTAGYDGPFVPRKKRTNEVWLIKKP